MTTTLNSSWHDLDPHQLADDLAHRLWACRCERRDLTEAMRKRHPDARTDAMRDDLLAVLRLERDLGLMFASAQAAAQTSTTGTGTDSTPLTTARLIEMWHDA
jgi:hypothetical protein